MRRGWLIQPLVRSTSQRRGWTMKPQPGFRPDTTSTVTPASVAAVGLPGVAVVHPHVADGWCDRFGLAQQCGECGPTLQVGRGEDGGDQDTSSIDQRMPLDAVDLVAAEAARPGHRGRRDTGGIDDGRRGPGSLSVGCATLISDEPAHHIPLLSGPHPRAGWGCMTTPAAAAHDRQEPGENPVRHHQPPPWPVVDRAERRGRRPTPRPSAPGGEDSPGLLDTL